MKKTRHFVLNIDDNFNDALAAVKFLLKKKSDGEVLRHALMMVFYSYRGQITDSIKQIGEYKNINSLDIIKKVKNFNFIKTNDIKDGFMSLEQIKQVLNIDNTDTSNNKIAAILKSMGFKQARTKDARVWLMRHR